MVTRPQRRHTRGQLAAVVVGAVVIGIVAGWIAYLALNPAAVTGDPANMASLSAQQLGELRSAAMADRLAQEGSVYGVPGAVTVDPAVTVGPVGGYASLSAQQLGELRSAAMADRLAQEGSIYGVPSAGTADPSGG